MNYDDIFDDELDEAEDGDLILPKLIEVDSHSYDLALKHLTKYRDSLQYNFEELKKNMDAMERKSDKDNLKGYLEDLGYEINILTQILFELKAAVLSAHTGDLVTPNDIN